MCSNRPAVSSVRAASCGTGSRNMCIPASPPSRSTSRRPSRTCAAFSPCLLPSDDASRTKRILDSVALAAVRVTDTGLVATLRFDVPPRPQRLQPATEAPLTEVERVQLRAALERWDAFLTYVIKAAGSDAATKEARQELLDILLDARQELIGQLEADPAGRPLLPLRRSTRGEDPVRRLFVSTWTRLAPVLRKQSGKLPGRDRSALFRFSCVRRRARRARPART